MKSPVSIDRNGVGGFTYLDVGRFYFARWPKQAKQAWKRPGPWFSRGVYGAWIGPFWVGRMPRRGGGTPK